MHLDWVLNADHKQYVECVVETMKTSVDSLYNYFECGQIDHMIKSFPKKSWRNETVPNGNLNQSQDLRS